ncbi:MAG TPA: inositol monophosphatase family protein [Chroococcales cyanobacterium]
MDSNKARETAVKAALDAGKYILKRLGQIERIDYKSAFNIVTDVDKKSEAMILEILHSQFPEDDVIAEESGLLEKGRNGRRWYIDPLDGTTNFTHTYPFFAVSIGLEIEGKMELGVVYHCCADELFVAERGKGAFLNDKPIQVSATEHLNTSLLATGFPPDTAKTSYNNMEPFTRLTNLSHGVRRDGSAALDLSFVACGRSDGFWEMKLSAWDVAAGSLIVSEAGGNVTDLQGGPLDMTTGHILATNGKIHQEVIDVLHEIGVEA